MRQRTYLLDQLAGLIVFSTDRPSHESLPAEVVARVSATILTDLTVGSGQWDGNGETTFAVRLAKPAAPRWVAAHAARIFDQDAVLLHDPAPYGPFGRGVWRLVNATGADLAKPVAFESVEFIPPGSTENHTTLTLGVAGPVSFRVPFEVAP